MHLLQQRPSANQQQNSEESKVKELTNSDNLLKPITPIFNSKLSRKLDPNDQSGNQNQRLLQIMRTAAENDYSNNKSFNSVAISPNPTDNQSVNSKSDLFNVTTTSKPTTEFVYTDMYDNKMRISTIESKSDNIGSQKENFDGQHPSRSLSEITFNINNSESDSSNKPAQGTPTYIRDRTVTFPELDQKEHQLKQQEESKGSSEHIRFDSRFNCNIPIQSIVHEKQKRVDDFNFTEKGFIGKRLFKEDNSKTQYQISQQRFQNQKGRNENQRMPFQLKLLRKNRKNGLVNVETFNTYRDYEIFPETQDQELLNTCIIEAMQDDDVDTDCDILESAIQSCSHDLRIAQRRVEKQDKTINYAMLRNYRIDIRTKRPQLFDRNGLYKDTQSESLPLKELPQEIRQGLNQQKHPGIQSCQPEIEKNRAAVNQRYESSSCDEDDNEDEFEQSEATSIQDPYSM